LEDNVQGVKRLVHSTCGTLQ